MSPVCKETEMGTMTRREPGQPSISGDSRSRSLSDAIRFTSRGELTSDWSIPWLSAGAQTSGRDVQAVQGGLFRRFRTHPNHYPKVLFSGPTVLIVHGRCQKHIRWM